MANTITGKLVKVDQVVTGTGSRGQWKKQEFVIEVTGTNFPTSAHFVVWKEDVIAKLAAFAPGSVIEVSFDYSSREHNGRWFDEGRAWNIAPATVQAAAPQTPAPSAPAAAPIPGALDVPVDDLP